MNQNPKVTSLFDHESIAVSFEYYWISIEYDPKIEFFSIPVSPVTLTEIRSAWWRGGQSILPPLGGKPGARNLIISPVITGCRKWRKVRWVRMMHLIIHMLSEAFQCCVIESGSQPHWLALLSYTRSANIPSADGSARDIRAVVIASLNALSGRLSSCMKLYIRKWAMASSFCSGTQHTHEKLDKG